METIKFYGQTNYRIYWNSNLQFTTNNEDLIKLFILNAKNRGEDINKYHINSNVAPVLIYLYVGKLNKKLTFKALKL